MHYSTVFLALTVMAAMVQVSEADFISDLICQILEFLIKDLLACDESGESVICDLLWNLVLEPAGCSVR